MSDAIAISPRLTSLCRYTTASGFTAVTLPLQYYKRFVKYTQLDNRELVENVVEMRKYGDEPEAPVANSTVEAPIAMAVNTTAMAQMNKTMVDTSLLKGCCFTFTATDSEMQLEPPREDRTPVDCAQESDYWSATTDCPKRTFDAMFLAFSHIHEFEGKKISPSLVKLNDTDPAQRILSL
eukprot:1395342-Amorphochlora_amoeboformis.AAC.1